MKYNLDDLHWQEFEVLSFKILQILIAKDVQFLEGGNDQGRDVVYNGISSFNNSYSGKWNFQVKHKSKLNEDGEIASALAYDLKHELKKVFVTANAWLPLTRSSIPCGVLFLPFSLHDIICFLYY